MTTMYGVAYRKKGTHRWKGLLDFPLVHGATLLQGAVEHWKREQSFDNDYALATIQIDDEPAESIRAAAERTAGK